jgi:hypothetical protein
MVRTGYAGRTGATSARQHNLRRNPCRVSANGVYEPMRFVETPVFTRAVTALLDEEQYRALQLALALRPKQGDVILAAGAFGNCGRTAPIGVLDYPDAIH